MTKTYQHTFKSGEVATFVVDFSQSPPGVVATPGGMGEKYPEEYLIWSRSVVVPDVMNMISSEQASDMAAYVIARMKEGWKP